MAQSTLAGVESGVIEWRVHLARRRPLHAAAAVLCVIAGAGAAYLMWHHPLASAGAGFLVLSAAAEFLFPITYRMGSDGVWCRNFLSLRHLSWADVRRCYRDVHGIKLSPLGRRSRLEAYRGIYLWLGDDEKVVVDTLRGHLRQKDQS